MPVRQQSDVPAQRWSRHLGQPSLGRESRKALFLKARERAGGVVGLVADKLDGYATLHRAST